MAVLGHIYMLALLMFALTVAVVSATAGRCSWNPRSVKVENFETFPVVADIKSIGIQMANFKFAKVLKDG